MYMTFEKHEAHTNIITYGEKGDKFYMIISGVLEIYVPNNDGDYVKVGELKEGGSFGELALLNDSPRLATIRTITDCGLAILEKKDYIRIIGRIN